MLIPSTVGSFILTNTHFERFAKGSKQFSENTMWNHKACHKVATLIFVIVWNWRGIHEMVDCYTQYITEYEGCFIVECSFLIYLHVLPADLESSSWWFGIVWTSFFLGLFLCDKMTNWLATWELYVEPAVDGIMNMLCLSLDQSSFGYSKGHHTLSILLAWLVEHNKVLKHFIFAVAAQYFSDQELLLSGDEVSKHLPLLKSCMTMPLWCLVGGSIFLFLELLQFLFLCLHPFVCVLLVGLFF